MYGEKNDAMSLFLISKTNLHAGIIILINNKVLKFYYNFRHFCNIYINIYFFEGTLNMVIKREEIPS